MQNLRVDRFGFVFIGSVKIARMVGGRLQFQQGRGKSAKFAYIRPGELARLERRAKLAKVGYVDIE